MAGSNDELTTLDLLDALVRKSLLAADRSSGRTRYSMLETIRQFAEEQLVAGDDADSARTAHARYFAGHEITILALWDSPRQSEAYEWFTTELANMRTAFRWAADHNDLDTAATIAVGATMLGIWLEQHEPASWAEEIIEAARVIEHRRLAQLYVMAAQCYAAGRIDDAVDYAEAGLAVLEREGSIKSHTKAWSGSAAPTWRRAGPSDGSRSVATYWHKAQTLTRSPAPASLWR